jgi:hypothetical protein
MRGYLRGLSCLVFTGAVIGGLLAAGPVTAAGAAVSGTATCAGASIGSPGVLTGTVNANVVVKGICVVNAGPAVVSGNVTVSPGSVLVAAFGLNDTTGTGHSSLTVKGNVYVRTGATAVLGCNPANFACIDDPNQNAPTLSSHFTAGLDVRSNGALGVIVHNFSVGGDVIQTGGGGGRNCTPQGIFKLFNNSPVYSAYEVGKVGGDVRISSVQSCWMGIVQLKVGNTMVMYFNKLADPDAIEILANNITGNLICRGNSRTWDSSEASFGGPLFPRIPQPNTVGRNRKGQCVLSSPTKPGGPLGPGPF